MYNVQCTNLKTVVQKKAKLFALILKVRKLHLVHFKISNLYKNRSFGKKQMQVKSKQGCPLDIDKV